MSIYSYSRGSLTFNLRLAYPFSASHVSEKEQARSEWKKTPGVLCYRNCGLEVTTRWLCFHHDFFLCGRCVSVMNKSFGF